MISQMTFIYMYFYAEDKKDEITQKHEYKATPNEKISKHIFLQNWVCRLALRVAHRKAAPLFYEAAFEEKLTLYSD
jgi:hypothetical protein